MSFAAGSRIGRYEIVAPLGPGARGEVYRAHDTRLQREVALKVLPAETLGDRDGTGAADARSAARLQLNHPHICTIYEVGESGTSRPFVPSVSKDEPEPGPVDETAHRRR